MSSIKPLYDNIKLSCAIVGDTHIDEKHPQPWIPPFFLKHVLKDTKKSARRQDAFITVGDITSRGSEANWEMTKKCYEKVADCAENIILPIGNHDAWHDKGFNEAFKNYIKYTNIICGTKQERTYFSRTLNGYHFIFIGSDSDAGCDASLSDEQIKWFENEMETASADGKPVFVFCHQCINQTHGLPVTNDRDEEYKSVEDGGIGEKSAEIAAILKKHKNVYYFSGHLHMGFAGEKMLKEKGYASIYSDGGLTLINLPSVACGNHHGEENKMCEGVVLEVYDDKVVIRPRNFLKRAWLKISIKDGKNYYEQKL